MSSKRSTKRKTSKRRTQSRRSDKQSGKKSDICKRNKSKIVKAKYNPKLIVKPATFKRKGKTIKINVVRDDLLKAGTKQRGMIPYFQQNKAQEFVYVTPTTGSAQATLAYSAKLTGKSVTLFMAKMRPRHPLTKKALSFGTVKLIEVAGGNFKKMRDMAEKYVNDVQKECGDDYIELLTLGFHNEVYMDIIVSQLKKAIPAELKKNPPKRFWVPSGSTLILNALYKVFPDTHFLAVQTGKTIWPDMYNQSNTDLYVSKEFFYDDAKEQPPFPTTKAYDAKAWTFVKKYGKNGDYLWNVTKDN